MTGGRVYLVGAGPGDPGLITVRGKEVLSRADVVVYDYLVSPRLLECAPRHAEKIYAGKRGSSHALEQDEIEWILVDRARFGANVVRLKGGDPFVFGRGGEEALALAGAGIPFEVVPGVTAAIAAAAYSGIPVTHRGLSSAVALVTGHETPAKDEPALHWQALGQWKGTLAFYMGVENIEQICASLVEHGLAADTPAAVIQWGTTPAQKVVVATVAGLAEAARASGVKPPAIIIVGDCVALREKLRWFETRPLFGRRVMVTRARTQASELSRRLEELGAETVELPVIRIEPARDPRPLKKAARRLSDFDWVIFTSANGVEAFFAAARSEGLDARALAGVRVAAIGPATAARLAAFGIRADLEPAESTSASLEEALSARGALQGARVLCLRADIAPKDFEDALAARGASVTAIAAYRTVRENADAETAAGMLARGEVDWVTFTSASTVTNLAALVRPETLNRSGATVASIGPLTSAAARALGLDVAAEAREHTIEGLVDCIVRHEDGRLGAPL